MIFVICALAKSHTHSHRKCRVENDDERTFLNNTIIDLVFKPGARSDHSIGQNQLQEVLLKMELGTASLAFR
jgi:hypothetical protein